MKNSIATSSILSVCAKQKLLGGGTGGIKLLPLRHDNREYRFVRRTIKRANADRDLSVFAITSFDVQERNLQASRDDGVACLVARDLPGFFDSELPWRHYNSMYLSIVSGRAFLRIG